MDPRSGATRTSIYDWKEIYGFPSVETLELWRRRFNESFLPGGVNHSVALEAGYIPNFTSARLIEVASGRVIAVASS